MTRGAGRAAPAPTGRAFRPGISEGEQPVRTNPTGVH